MIRVQNAGSSSKNLWIEPWGDQIVMQPEDAFEIVANGPVGDCLEVACANSDIVIYAWAGVDTVCAPFGGNFAGVFNSSAAHFVSI